MKDIYIDLSHSFIIQMGATLFANARVNAHYPVFKANKVTHLFKHIVHKRLGARLQCSCLNIFLTA